MHETGIKEMWRTKKHFIMLWAIFWIAVITLKTPLADSGKYNVIKEHGRIGGDYIEPVIEGREVAQPFTARQGHMQGVSVFTWTFARENTSDIELQLEDDATKEVVASQKVNAGSSEIKDGDWYELSFPEIADSQGRSYTLTISGINGSPENAITLSSSRELADKEKPAVIDGKSQNFHINYRVKYNMPQFFYLKVLVWCFVIALSFLCMVWVKGTTEKDFLKIAILIGSSFIIFTTFPHVIDEMTHFFRSFCISKLEFLNVTQDGKIGAFVSRDFAAISDSRLNFFELFKNWEFWKEPFSKETYFYENPYVSSVLPTGHSVAAIGIALGNFLGLSKFLVVWFSRGADFTFYLFFCYLAIKDADYYKTLFFFLSLLPMGIWLGASCSQDPVVIASSLLFVSLCLKYYFHPDFVLKKRDVMLMLISVLFFCSVKYLIYLPLIVLTMLIPKKNRIRKLLIAGELIIIIVIIISQVELLQMFPFKEDRNGDVDVERQIRFVFSNLYFSYRNFILYFLESLLPHLEGLGYTPAFLFFHKLVGLVGVVIAILACDKFEFKREDKKLIYVSVVIPVLIFCLTIGALYVGFTPVGAFRVDGLQTRYLIPFLPLVMIALSTVKVKNEIKNYNETVAFFTIICLLNMEAGTLIAII